MFHYVWQRRQMTSMSSPRRIIFEFWLPKRKVTLLMTLFTLVVPYEEWKIENLKQNKRACPFWGNCKSFKLLFVKVRKHAQSRRQGQDDTKLLKKIRHDTAWTQIFKSMVFSLCIQLNPSLMNLQHPFINFWKCILQNN